VFAPAIVSGLLATLTIAAAAPDGAIDPKLLEKAHAIHKKIIVFDSHVDIPLDFQPAVEGKSQIDLVKLARGQVKGAALAVFVSQDERTPRKLAAARQEAEKKYALIRGIADDNPSRAALAYTPADVRRIAGEGKFAVVISLLNAYPLGDDIRQIDEWYGRGVRIFGFVHAGHNQWADSSRPNAGLGDKLDEHGGLSPLGKQAVRKLNDLGVLIDVSQLSDKAFADTLSLTRAPVAATHSAVRSLVDATRNLSDEQLLAIEKNGGVAQIVAFSNYLRPLPADTQAKLKALQSEFGFLGGQKPAVLSDARRKEYFDRYHALVYAVPKATVSQLVDHIDYAVKKIGVDHVGISSDFNHGGGVIGWDNEGEAENVTVELLRRGYKEQEIAKLWGGNFLRVWEKAQEQARR
jgi:microsomal dipeptidase-like Zn-dependent dipeptidase